MSKLPILLTSRQSEFLRDLLHTINPEYILNYLIDSDSLDDAETTDLLTQLEIIDPQYFFGVKNARSSNL